MVHSVSSQKTDTNHPEMDGLRRRMTRGHRLVRLKKKVPKKPMFDHHVPIKIVTSGYSRYSPLLDKPIFVIAKSHFQPCNLKIDFT